MEEEKNDRSSVDKSHPPVKHVAESIKFCSSEHLGFKENISKSINLSYSLYPSMEMIIT